MQALVLCLVLLAAGATVARAQDTLCPAGLEGPDCGMCAGGTTLGDEACANLTESYSGWCYSNHTWAEGSTAKSYDCTTEARVPLLPLPLPPLARPPPLAAALA